MIRYGECKKFVQATGVSDSELPDCCESCHDDLDEGLSDLCTVRIGQRQFEVCCKVKMWAELQKDYEKNVWVGYDKVAG